MGRHVEAHRQSIGTATGKVRPERCVNLAYADGALESMHSEPAKPFGLACEPRLRRSELRSINALPDFRGNPPCTWNSLVDELRRVLEMSKPDVIICRIRCSMPIGIMS